MLWWSPNFSHRQGLAGCRCGTGRDLPGHPVGLIFGEAHTFVRDHKGSDKESKQLAALAAQNARLLEELVKMGRSAGMIVILVFQKTTGDAIPTFIRDVCPVGLSFAQKTIEAAVAALGDDIRLWPDANPTVLQEPAYVSEADSAGIAARTAHLTADPADLLATQLPGIDLMKDDSDDDAIPPLAA
ncbi:hypothetical protein AB0E62_03105 [Streptomyces sp. NPDC038707]|uniref:hypothetical protein n=1 Tax=Streptomyces sp. NPDC038707 TaxID=3154329 RepID=UPI00340913A7